MRIGSGRSLLTKEQLAALGAIVIESAEMESTVDFMINLLLEAVAEIIEELTRNKMLGANIDLLKTCGLAKINGKNRKQRQQEFTRLMNHCKLLTSQRAIAIHGTWQPEGGMKLNDLMQMMMGKWERRDAEAKHKKGQMKAERLEALADDFNKIDEELRKFGKQNWLTPKIQKLTRASARRQREMAVR